MLSFTTFGAYMLRSSLCSDNPITASFHISAHCTCGWRCRCQDDPNSSSIKELEETTRESPYHVAEHCPARHYSLQPHTEWRSRSRSELPSVEADVYIWRHTLLVCTPEKKMMTSIHFSLPTRAFPESSVLKAGSEPLTMHSVQQQSGPSQAETAKNQNKTGQGIQSWFTFLK